MRLLVFAALAAALVLTESAALDKKDLSKVLLQELQEMVSAKEKQEEARPKGDQDKRQDDDDGLPDMHVIFEDCRDRAFIGVLLSPDEAVSLVQAAEQTQGWIAEGINIYTMGAFFFEDRDDWMLGNYLTSEWAVGIVSGLHGVSPPVCVYGTTGCDISGYTKTLADKDDIAFSGYGMAMTDAIPLVGSHISDTGEIDEDAIHTDVAAKGSRHAGHMVGYGEAVAGVSAALGVESPVEAKKSLAASKKNAEIAELLQKLREYVRDLQQK
ncbi:hypothetical protein Bbelb_032660 [Branchiostoma belcheri]|nr:hypothetical protein Bbelb_032660 [Branchiostoma belcheri]